MLYFFYYPSETLLIKLLSTKNSQFLSFRELMYAYFIHRMEFVSCSRRYRGDLETRHELLLASFYCSSSARFCLRPHASCLEDARIVSHSPQS